MSETGVKAFNKSQGGTRMKIQPFIGKIRKSHAFTMIEVMIVMAVIGVLASLAIVLTGRATERAHKISAKHDLGQFVRAQVIHHNEFDIYDTDLHNNFNVTKWVKLTFYQEKETGHYIAGAFHEKHNNVTFFYNFNTEQWSKIEKTE
jgi:prepilin-type N-terminal cleavage/methylation domain-containing protein